MTRRKPTVILLVALVVLFPTSWSCPWPLIIQHFIENPGKDIEKVIEEDAGKDMGDPGYYSASDPTIQPASPSDIAPPGGPAGGELPLKPVCFLNTGTIPATVMPWTYIPLNTVTNAIPSNASTVAFPGGNPSACLSLPMGTYTWCYHWELGDRDGDLYIDYAHAIDSYPVLLDGSDFDSLDLAEKISLSVPPVSGELPGRCGTPPIPTGLSTSPRPTGDLLFSDDGSGGASAMFDSTWMTFGYSGGQGTISAIAESSFVLPAMYASSTPANFVMEVDLVSYGGAGGYGFIFRSDDVPDGLFYYNMVVLNPGAGTVGFAVWSSNQWGLWAEYGLGEEVGSVAPPVPLRIEAIGGEIRVFVNDKFAAVFQDYTNTSAGIFGMTLVSASSGDSFTYDNLQVYSIP